ncbi:MAG: N-acetyltransferase [Hyphomicrobiales bacterium]
MSSNSNYTVNLQTADDADEILRLHEITFGPGRFARTAFRIRENASLADELCFTARDVVTEKLVGSVLLSHIKIGEVASLLLGPLTVTPEYKSKGVGKLLMQRAVEAAQSAGYGSIILVGDEPYYGPFGFKPVGYGQIQMPGPVDPKRLLVCSFSPDRNFDATGIVRGVIN